MPLLWHNSPTPRRCTRPGGGQLLVSCRIKQVVSRGAPHRDLSMKLMTPSFIAHKRDGHSHSPQEIAAFIDAFLRGSVADYQMTAWLMAVYMRGLDDEETVALTQAMLHSGRVLKRPQAGAPRIDKHSTGGVGDKISLPLAAIAACSGLSVPMIAGRGLGHTGGTLDKLEAISGYQVSLSVRRFAQIVGRVGASIMGQTADIAPA